MSKSNFTGNIVILTGAGISAESGIATFRDKDGVWSKVSPEEVATPQAFARDPEKVLGFHNAGLEGMKKAEANDAHRALARLETDHPGDVLIVTQNVDDLHEKGGATNLLHMHGEFFKARCDDCGTVVEFRAPLFVDTPCGACSAVGYMRPHVVWFNEIPFHMDEIDVALNRADLFISIGTSGNVYPAANFVSVARHSGTPTVELNLEPSDGARLFDHAVYGKAGEIVPQFVDDLLAGRWHP